MGVQDEAQTLGNQSLAQYAEAWAFLPSIRFLVSETDSSRSSCTTATSCHTI